MKQKNRYRVVATQIAIEGITVKTYGIVIECGSMRAVVEDISTDRRAVKRLCAQLRTGNLAPMHLRDVVMDWLDSDPHRGIYYP